MDIRQGFLERSGNLESILSSLPKSHKKRRLFLYRCNLRFHENHGSDIIESVFIYLDEILINNGNALDLYDEAKKDLSIGRGEYGFSLNAISESLHLIFEPRELSDQDLILGLELILFAFSCIFEEEEFLKDESHAFIKLAQLC